jgi:hypothetical protein
MEIDSNNWLPEFSRKQSDAWWLLQEKFVDELLYGGAKGGGKSIFGCYWMYLECYEIARKYIPNPLKHPVPIGFMGRKVAKHFKETTLDTWKRFIPPNMYQMKGDPAEIVIAERVMIRTGGLEAKEDLEKFNSAEFARIFVDQAEETTKDDISVLRASLRLVLNKGKHKKWPQKIKGKILWTANPAPGWLKTDFIDNPKRNMPFVRALPTDNHWMGAEYIKTLEKAFEHRPELLAAYRDGCWDAFEGSDQIIFQRWIDKARGNIQFNTDKIIACDPARFGDDETVIFLLEGSEIVKKEIMGVSKTTQISNYICRLSRDNGHCPAVIDEIGVGGGVVDELVDMGVKVIPYNSSNAAVDSEKYVNLRAESWFEAAKEFSDGKIKLANIYPKLSGQLCVPKYLFKNNGRIMVEPKKDIKKRLGVSPDHADCYIIGLWGQRQRRDFGGGIDLNEIELMEAIENV